MSQLDIVEIESDIVPSPVACAVLLPPGYDGSAEPRPLCISLHGGGSSHEALVYSQRLFDALWSADSLVPMVIVSTNTTPLSFYFDDPESGGAQWETFVSEELPNWVRANYHVRSDQDGTVMTGASMDGYGTLKIAFRHPDRFCAIAAMEPAIEPGTTRADSPLRSRLYSAVADVGIARLIGPKADISLFDSNAPSTRLLSNADAVRASGMEIYLECGDHDALNLQDGTEYLHRLLWDLDISHEYHLVKDADHVGQFAAPKAEIEKSDPTVNRRDAKMPPTGLKDS